MLAEEEGGKRASRSTPRPIYTKLTGLKKGVKSESDVSKRVLLEVSNQFSQQEASPAQLSREGAVRVRGFESPGSPRRERAQLVELG